MITFFFINGIILFSPHGAYLMQRERKVYTRCIFCHKLQLIFINTKKKTLKKLYIPDNPVSPTRASRSIAPKLSSNPPNPPRKAK